MSLTIESSMVVTAEINDGKITLRVLEKDLIKLIEILQYNNLKNLDVKMEPEDWKQWPRLGNHAWEKIKESK